MPTPSPSRLFDWLEQVRAVWGWGQREFAAAISSTPNAMRGWERGSMPRRTSLAAIAAGVGVPVAALHQVMEGEQVPIPPAPPRLRSVPATDDELSDRVEHLGQQVQELTTLVLRLLNDRGPGR